MNGAADPANVPTPTVDVKAAVEQISKARAQWNKRVVASERLGKILFESLVANTHTFVAGPGGSGKTYAAEAMRDHFPDLSFFYTQFRPDMRREEVFGPLSMSALQQDRYEHQTAGYMPTAEVFIGDEFVDAGRFTRQLLNALNEGWFVNGNRRERIPLMSGIFLTNFWIEQKELEALFDRLASRIIQDHIEAKPDWRRVLELQIDDFNEPIVTVTREQLTAVQAASRQIDVPQAVRKTTVDLVSKAAKEGLPISPRRMYEGIKRAQARALLRGGGTVNQDDLAVFETVLPNTPDDFAAAEQLCVEFKGKVANFVAEIRPAATELSQKLKPVRDALKAGNPADMAVVTEVMGAWKPLEAKIDAAVKQFTAEGCDVTELTQLADSIRADRDFIKQEVFG